MTTNDGWRSVADDPPPKDSWVLVWHRGTLTLAKYAPAFPVPGVHDWLLMPPGRNPFAPFPPYHPRWWRPNLDPPSDVENHDLGPSEEVGETLIRWRGSVCDLATDLREVVPFERREELCEALVALQEKPKVGASHPERRETSAKIDFNSAYGKQRTGMTAEIRQVALAGVLGDCNLLSEFVGDLKAVLSGEKGWNAFLHEVRQQPEPPVPMLLWCPECNERHVDAGEFATKVHHTHECQFCGHVWRPAVIPTVGVRFLFRKSTEPEASLRAPALSRRDPEQADRTQQTADSSGSGQEPGAGSREPSSEFWCQQCSRLCTTIEDHGAKCPERSF